MQYDHRELVTELLAEQDKCRKEDVNRKLSSNPLIKAYQQYFGKYEELYPFVESLTLSELVDLHCKQKGNFRYYNASARQTYFRHQNCVRRCILLLFSNDQILTQ